MADLSRVLDDLSALSVLETAELSRLIEERWSGRLALTVATNAAISADAEDWIAAEFLALQRDAVRLAASLNETLTYVSERCGAVLSA